MNDLIGTLFSFSFSLTHVFEMFSLLSFFQFFIFVFSASANVHKRGMGNGMD